MTFEVAAPRSVTTGTRGRVRMDMTDGRVIYGAEGVVASMEDGRVNVRLSTGQETLLHVRGADD